MISFLKGNIKNKETGYIVVLVNNIGYKVFLQSALYSDLAVDDPVELYIHENIKEGIYDLYGFKNLEQLSFFELLLTISGVGPKSALGVLSIASVNEIKESIAQGDPSLLTKVSGIGRKTAERVVLELRGKVGYPSGGGEYGANSALRASGEEIDALVALGYSLQQAREALKRVDKSINDSGERIKAALKNIGS